MSDLSPLLRVGLAILIVGLAILLASLVLRAVERSAQPSPVGNNITEIQSTAAQADSPPSSIVPRHVVERVAEFEVRLARSSRAMNFNRAQGRVQEAIRPLIDDPACPWSDVIAKANEVFADEMRSA